MSRAISTPFGLTGPQYVQMSQEMMDIAARAYPPSPEGFALGVIVGRMQAAGIDAAGIHYVVDVALGLKPARPPEVPS